VYAASVELDPEARRASGDLDVRFVPDLRVEELVFRLWANGPSPAEAGSDLRITSVEAGAGGAEAQQPDPTTLVVELAEPLEAGEPIGVHMEWEWDLPGDIDDRTATVGDAVRMGTFLPLLAWEPGVGWAREPPTSGFAETVTSPIADYEVSIDVPEGFEVLATGRMDGGGTWRATAVRDFAASVGRFRTARARVDVGEPVDVIVGVHEGVDQAPEEFLRQVVSALRRFSFVYGAYAWPTLTVAVTPELGGGIEFPTHLMLGPSTLGRTTTHEVAHMWFYALVGNDQARDPWLDEGLASWAEARAEDQLDQFRSSPVPEDAAGRVGEPMTYWEEHLASYYRGVYVQGAVALGELGSPELVDCALAHYVARNAWRVATTEDLFSSLEVVFPDAREVLLPAL